MLIASREATILHSLAQAIVPASGAASAEEWQAMLEIISSALTARPRTQQRQLRLFLWVLQWLPAIRWGRVLTALDDAQRRRFLTWVQDAPLTLVRRGFWGIRTLILMGYYTRSAAAREIGYAARPEGWEAR